MNEISQKFCYRVQYQKVFKTYFSGFWIFCVKSGTFFEDCTYEEKNILNEHKTFCLTSLIIKCKICRYFKIWWPSSISELTPIIFNIE